MTTKLPNCTACGKQIELILNKCTWLYGNQEPDKVDIWCLCDGDEGGIAKVLVKDLDPEHQKFFGKLKKQIEEKNIHDSS